MAKKRRVASSCEVLREALGNVRVWERRHGVLGLAIGVRHRQGEFRSQRCVVVTVRQKLSPNELKHRRERPFPRFIEVAVRGQKVSVPVDVWAARSNESEGKLQGLVGTRVNRAGQHVGAVGAIVTQGQEELVLTAGHVARSNGARLMLSGGVRGTTMEVRMSSSLDHALVKPDQPLAADAAQLRDGSRLRGLGFISTNLLNKTVQVLRASSGQLRSTTVRQIDASAPFAFPRSSQTTQVRGLLAVDECTGFGDSGTLLFDSSRRALGTLVGVFSGFSLFLPCAIAFSSLRVQLLKDGFALGLMLRPASYLGLLAGVSVFRSEVLDDDSNATVGQVWAGPGDLPTKHVFNDDSVGFVVGIDLAPDVLSKLLN